MKINKVMKLIDKAAVVAEIEKWQDEIKKGIFSIPLAGRDKAFATFEYEVLGKIKDFINKLEVKEVDLEKELDRIWFDNKFGDMFDNSAVDFANVREICRHFFELGLKEQKGG